jgi:hypothetical protein
LGERLALLTRWQAGSGQSLHRAQPHEHAACVAILDYGESIRFGKQGA